MRNIMLASLLAAVSACHDRTPQVIAIPAPAELQKPGQMTVTGTATLEVSPDCADLTMTLAADAVRPGVATSQVDAKERALVVALDKLGVHDRDLKLSQLALNPIYEPNPEGYAQIKVHTYRAEITITATTHDFAKISDIMDTGAMAGATQMASQFRRSDLPTLKKQVRDMALAAAKDKAKQTASALDIKLGRVISVGENPGGMMWSNSYFPQAANVVESHNGGGALGGTLQPLTLDVTIGYELAAG